MANQNAQIIELYHSDRTAFEVAAASVTLDKQPIVSLIGGEAGIVLGVKANNVFSYLKNTDADLSAIFSGLSSAQAQIAQLYGLISGASVGPVLRGVFTIPPKTSGTGAGTIPYYSTTEANPLVGVRVSIDRGGDVYFLGTIFLGCQMAEALGSVAELGDGFLYVRAGVDDAPYLKLYDTLENAFDNGNTGWFGVARQLPDMTPGTYVIRGVTAGADTNETIGWVYTSTGLNMGALAGAAFQGSLLSRDFALTFGEMTRGFSVEVPFEIMVRPDNPSGGNAELTFRASIAGLNLFPVNGGAKLSFSTDDGSNVLSGRLRLVVLNKTGEPGSETLTISSSFLFDHLHGGGVYASPASEISTTVTASAMGPSPRLLNIHVQGNAKILSISFLRSSMSSQTPWEFV